MILTVFTKTETCDELVKVAVSHMCMFNQSQMELYFVLEEEQFKLMKALIKAYVTFECEGKIIRIDTKQYQRVKCTLELIF